MLHGHLWLAWPDADEDAALCFDADGTRLAVGSRSRVAVFDLERGAEIEAHPVELGEFAGLTGGVVPDELALSADGRRLVTRMSAAINNAGDTYAWIQISERPSGRRLRTTIDDEARLLEMEGGGCLGCAISPDGRWLVTAGAPALELWDLTRGALVRVGDGALADVRAVGFGAASDVVAAAVEGAVWLVEVPSFTVRARLPVDAAGAPTLLWPDGDTARLAAPAGLLALAPSTPPRLLPIPGEPREPLALAGHSALWRSRAGGPLVRLSLGTGTFEHVLADIPEHTARVAVRRDGARLAWRRGPLVGLRALGR